MANKSKNNNKNEMADVDILDLLLDDDYDDPIFLFDEDSNKVAFEKVAIINLDQVLYFLLSPLDVIDGVSSDEALVFKTIEDYEGNNILVIEQDEQIATKVFDEYYRLLEEMQ